MISITKTNTIKETKEGTVVTGELTGLSTDTKPTELNGQTIGNGSTYIEMDTGKLYFFDADSKTWKEF